VPTRDRLSDIRAARVDGSGEIKRALLPGSLPRGWECRERDRIRRWPAR